MLKKTSTTAALSTLVASSLGLIAAQPAHATTPDYEVTNCNADGAGSLLNGFAVLNAGSGGTIGFSSSLNCTSITPSDSFSISYPTTLIGPTDKTITISPSPYGNFFWSYGADLSVSNLSFEGNGSMQFSRMDYGDQPNFDLTLDNVSLNNFGDAPVIAAGSGEITISHSTFTDDNSFRAFNLVAAPNLTVSDSEFIGNGYGEGSLLAASANLTVTDSKFENNDVTFSGGSLFGGDIVTLTNVVVTGTDATNIAAVGSRLSLYGSSVTNNTLGGDVFFGGQGSIELQNNTVAENAYGAGAAIFNANSTVATYNTFVNNEENNQQIGQVSQGSITLGGNIFASDENYAFRCSNVGTGEDWTGNLFTSQPEGCGLGTLPTTASNGASAVVSWADLGLQPGATLASGEKYWTFGTSSPAYNYITAITNGEFNPGTDQIGNSRPLSDKYDVGSIEMPSTQRACTPIANSLVNFAPYSSKLTNGSKAKLRAYANALHASGCTSIKINGYTATTSNAAPSGAAYRLALANKRTLAVKRYLQAQFARLGIQVTVTRQAHGAHSPKKTNNTASGRAANRRVEIVVVS